MSIRKKKTLDVVVIQWRDAVSRDEWEEAQVPLSPVLIFTVGILIRRTRSHIEVAANYDSVNHNDSCKMAIPKGMIESIQTIKTLKVRE